MADRTAGIIVIGNEILSGKVTDANSPFMAQGLRELGVELRRIVTIPDEVDLIAEEVRSFREAYDIVFTSGGVGPTHDDVTMEGIARGLDRKVIVHPDLEEGIRAFIEGEVNAAQLKMAEVPEGAVLIQDANLGFPTIQVENIYILPGIPEILVKKFNGLRSRFQAEPYYLKVIYSSWNESAIADSLNQTMREFPDLMLGSYPKISHPEYRVKLTIESKDEAYAQRAFDRLLDLLTADAVVRTE